MTQVTLQHGDVLIDQMKEEAGWIGGKREERKEKRND